MKELFTGILNISISAGIMIIVCVLVRLLFRKMPKFVRCLMWLLVAIRLAIPFAIESPLSLLPAKEYITVSSDDMTADTKSKETGSYTAVSVDETGNAYIESEVTDKAEAANRVDTFGKVDKADSKESGSKVVSENTAESVNSSDSGSFLKSIDVMYVLSILWIVGVGAVLIYAIVAYIRLRRAIDDAVLLEDNIYQSERAGTAFILGIIRPKIYVPYGLSLNERYMSISHEKAHIARRDHLVKPLGYIIAAVYWFNPLVWVAYILLCRDIELACDEKVIKKIGYDKKKDYSQALLNLSMPRSYISACPVAFGEVGINERIKNVLTMKKGKKIIIAVAVVICAVLAICFLTYPRKPKNNSGDVAKAQTSEETTESTTEITAEDLAADDENTTEVKDNSTAETEKDVSERNVYILKVNNEGVKVGEKYIIDGENSQLILSDSNYEFGAEMFENDPVVEKASAEVNSADYYAYEDSYKIVELKLVTSVDMSGSSNSEGEEIIFPVLGGGVIVRGFSEDHQGVDIAAEEGTAVVSIFDGNVEEVGSNEEGSYVIIKNDKGCTVKYSHLKDVPNVSKGDNVSIGNEVGKVGSTGKSTGPHVHIEMTDENGIIIDPMS